MSRRTRREPKNITERIIIEKLIPGGQALGARPDGKKVFLWNALPGEIVSEFQLTRDKSTYSEGIALTFENQAAMRVAPRDACYLSTSPWQIMTYADELEQKSQLLQEIYRQHKIELADNASIKTDFVTDGREYFYRNKMEYALYYDHTDQRIHLAFHQRGSHQKLAITQSSLEYPEIFQEAERIVAGLNQCGEPAWKYQSLLLRRSQSGQVSGGLYENGQPHPQFAPLSDEILGYKYSYSPNGFFQINLPVYELALRRIRECMKTDRVLDLYAGVGTIGLSVARDRELALVESDKSAYAELEHNCAGTSARPVYAKSEEALEYIQPDQTVILDPPRAGCDPKLVQKLLGVQPKQIIYLSCNPVTQARDVKILLDVYHMTAAQGFNFFPRTPHLENLIILEKK